MRNLHGKTVALLVADGFEQIELTSPKKALEDAGAKALIVSPKSGTVQGWNHFDKGDDFHVDVLLDEASAEDFDALVLPGGVANPDQLRANPKAVAFVKNFLRQEKPIAAICHGPWTLIDAKGVSGKRMTSYKSIRTDLVNAGADWVDQEVVVDRGMVTSRSPADLKAFNRMMVEEISAGARSQQAA